MSVYRYPFQFFTIILLLLLTAYCTTSSDNNKPENRYFEFTHADEEIDYRFIAKTSDPDVIDTIEQQLQQPFDQRNLHIHGDIERGDDGYNNHWSWHFEEDSWQLVEVSIEVCDGRPQMVEDNLDYWIDNVGYFCPWSSRVLGEVNP
jgi:hypothetical protein